MSTGRGRAVGKISCAADGALAKALAKGAELVFEAVIDGVCIEGELAAGLLKVCDADADETDRAFAIGGPCADEEREGGGCDLVRQFESVSGRGGACDGLERREA